MPVLRRCWYIPIVSIQERLGLYCNLPSGLVVAFYWFLFFFFHQSGAIYLLIFVARSDIQLHSLLDYYVAKHTERQRFHSNTSSAVEKVDDEPLEARQTLLLCSLEHAIL